MSHVFLSYCREDSDLMRRVRDDLRAAGLIVWTDESLIPGTPSWQNAIEFAIEHAVCTVALLTPQAKRADWVKNEILYAHSQGVTVYPLLAEGDEASAVPIALIAAQHIDMRAPNQYSPAIDRLIALIRQQAPAAPVTQPNGLAAQAELSTREELAIRRKNRMAVMRTAQSRRAALDVTVIITPLPPRLGRPVQFLITLENTGISAISGLEATYHLDAFPEGSRVLNGHLTGPVALDDGTLHPGESTIGRVTRPAEDQADAYIVRIRVTGTTGGNLGRIRAEGEAVVLTIDRP